MYITQCYKYRYNEVTYIGGNPPKGAEILETMDILNAKEGYDLIRIVDEDNVGSSVWLKDGDSQDNYKEIKIEE